MVIVRRMVSCPIWEPLWRWYPLLTLFSGCLGNNLHVMFAICNLCSMFQKPLAQWRTFRHPSQGTMSPCRCWPLGSHICYVKRSLMCQPTKPSQAQATSALWHFLCCLHVLSLCSDLFCHVPAGNSHMSASSETTKPTKEIINECKNLWDLGWRFIKFCVQWHLKSFSP